MRNALSGAAALQSDERPIASSSVADHDEPVPSVLRAAALVLLLSGILAIASAISGVSSFRPDLEHGLVASFSSPLLRGSIGACGLLMLALAVGVYRRQLWAWRLGFVVLVVMCLISVPQSLESSPFQDSVVVRIIFSAISVAVTIWWGWWWYAQREHFIAQAEHRAGDAA